ncbi:MAG: hypothetical protein H7831_01670 [Magnetococcus sp. WYHC-3]
MKVDKIWVRESRLTPQAGPAVDRESQERLKELRTEMLELLTRQRFLSFVKQPNFFYDNKLNGLWLLYGFKARPEEVQRYLDKLQVYAFRAWQLPTLEQLKTLTGETLFTTNDKFADATLLSSTPAKVKDGANRTITVGEGKVGVAGDGLYTVLPFHPVGQRDVFSFIVAHSLVPRDVRNIGEKLRELYALTVKRSQSQTLAPPSLKELRDHFLESDHIRARLPVLEPATLTDMGKGMWEFWHQRKPMGGKWVQVDLDTPWEARNPELDLRQGAVSIDFGTSSTVVACRENGKTTLLRVGMTDFFQKPRPEDYQNPTVMAFINLPNLLVAWNNEAYRPLTRWDDFNFSHAARRQFQENEGDQRVVGSVLANIKQWPLVQEPGKVARITDQNTGAELQIEPLDRPPPLKGQPLSVQRGDPFDPLELYAYYLGLYINHRASGLYLEYYMTFPVTYPRQVKQRILSSFARGLQRSLPLALTDSPHFERFSVREEASEPAAYAACALSELGLEASDKGIAYAVFDFGGGSTDFDFGVYRRPTPEESAQGYEEVIRHFGASGDMFLGGENLVANLAYQVFVDNLEVCREHRIPFALPPEATPFPGHELFIDQSHVAQTNSTLLMGKVRPLWESFEWNQITPGSEIRAGEDPGHPGRRRRLSDTIGDTLSQVILDEEFRVSRDACPYGEEDPIRKVTLELLSRDRQKVTVTLALDRNKLTRFLVHRVGKGIQRFFIAMRRAFESQGVTPEEIRVLQAGNSSRSMLVQALFSALLQDNMVGWDPPLHGLHRTPAVEQLQHQVRFARFVVHRPPSGDPDNPYKPTAKTGVAIGLLRLIPGETLLALGPSGGQEPGEAPFRLFVGRLERGVFKPVLFQNGVYGEWEELGVPTRNAFVLVHSTSPQAGLGVLRRGAVELKERSLSLNGRDCDGKRLFIRSIGPSRVELALAESLEQIQFRAEQIVHMEELDLY